MRFSLKNALPIFAVVLASCSQPAANPETASPTANPNDIKNTAPDAEDTTQQGYILPGLDHGFEQSPIDILSAANTNGKHNIKLFFNDDVKEIENLGHTVQLDFTEGSTIVQDDTTFAFKQCHFHTPSEHLIDGMTFPMEMHIVTLMPNEDKNATPQYLVIGILFKEGKENKFLADFLNAIPKEEGGTADLKAGTVKLADLFGEVPKAIKGNYYNYKGSLTTPPFTESVRWYISKHIFEATPEQIEAINKVEGNNARHVQALFGRTITTK